jgi:exonuclease SbcD
MIRIRHLADLHLGVESYGSIDPATGLSTRLGDFLAALDEAVDYAIASKVDLTLFCGDAYKSRDPSQTQQREFAKRVARLAQNGIPVLLVVGNHDLPAALGRATTVEIFPTLAVSNVVVAGRLATHRIETKSGPIQVIALPWVRRSTLMTREDTRSLTLAQVTQRIEELITEGLAREIDALDPSVPAILAAHVTVSTARLGSERSMMMGQEHVLLHSAVADPRLDYVALGHIHRHQVLSQNPHVAYAGSLQPIDFGEEGEEKGFCVVELDEGTPQGQRLRSFEFRKVAARPFLTIKVKATTDNPTAEVLEAIARARVEGAIVRVLVSLSPSNAGLLQENEVRRALSFLGRAHFIAAVTKEVERQPRARLAGRPTEGLTPLEGLRAYLEAKRMPPERAQVLLDYGERLITQVTGFVAEASHPELVEGRE